MSKVSNKLKSIIRKEGYIAILGLIEEKEYTSEEVLIGAIELKHIDLIDMLLDEYPTLKNTPRILNKIFYLTNLTHYPKVTKVVLSHIPLPLRIKYTNIRLANKSTFKN